MAGDADTSVPLTPAELNILLALADGEQHGYAIPPRKLEDAPLRELAQTTDREVCVPVDECRFRGEALRRRDHLV